MSGRADIRGAIRELARDNDDTGQLQICVVTAVNGNHTIDAQPVTGEAEIYDVKIQSSTIDEGVLLTPDIGSYVIVGMISNESGYVVSRDVIRDIMIKVQGVDVQQQVKALFDMLSNLIGILKTFQLMTAQGPTSNVMPQVVVKLEQQDVKLTQIQNQLNRVLKQFN